MDTSPPLSPHHDSALEDFCFSLVHLVAMVGCDNKFVFPAFSREALKTAELGKSDGRVSTLWSDLFDDFQNTSKDRINEKLSSHCNRKGSNQVMAESSLVLGMAQIFRVG